MWSQIQNAEHTAYNPSRSQSAQQLQPFLAVGGCLQGCCGYVMQHTVTNTLCGAVLQQLPLLSCVMSANVIISVGQ